MDELIYPNKKIPTRCPHCKEFLTHKERQNDESIPVTFYKYVPLEAAEKTDPCKILRDNNAGEAAAAGDRQSSRASASCAGILNVL